MLLRLFFIVLFTVLTARATDQPPYLQEALTRFNPAIPPDWAYTLTTQRGDESSVERFDPSRPTEQQWTLLQRNHRPATAEENSRYDSYRISTSPSARASFVRDDIDLQSLRLVREDETRAEYHASFRDDLKDPMLHRLELQLTVSKSRAAIEQFVLLLTAPYSPVLTVSMLELRVETTLSPPEEARPALPLRIISRFRGRVFLFKSIEEDVQTAFSDYVLVRPHDPQPAGTPP